MFRIKDVINIAVQIEKNGERSYRQASEQTTIPAVRDMLRIMAEEEKHHRQWFESLHDDSPIPPEHADLEEMGRNLLQEMIATETFSLDQAQLNSATTLNEILTQSRKFEEDTVLFYEFLKGLIEEPETVKIIDTIIEEERSHAERLEKMLRTHLLAVSLQAG